MTTYLAKSGEIARRVRELQAAEASVAIPEPETWRDKKHREEAARLLAELAETFPSQPEIAE